MISEGFAVIGLWVCALAITFVVIGLLAFFMACGDNAMDDSGSFIVALVIFVVLVELVLCAIYVPFKNNPEQFGYTRIETEVETDGENNN